MSVFILLVLLLLQITPTQCIFQSSDVQSLSCTRDTIPTTNVINQMEDVSRLVCGTSCLSEQSCVSFFYNKQTSTCSIHDTLFSESPESSESSKSSESSESWSETSQMDLEYYRLLDRQVNPCPPPYTYLSLVDMCIRVVQDRKVWLAASSWCENLGDHLVVLDTQIKNIIVSTFVVFSYADYDGDGFYIGGQYISKRWQWVNGEEINPSSEYWMRGYPADITSENRFLIISSTSQGMWCNERNIARYFICEKDLN